MIITFDKRITATNPNLFEVLESKSTWFPVYYILDSSLRKAVSLVPWLREQIDNPCQELKDICAEIPFNKEPDYTITEVLRWVQKNITYTPDSKVWKTPERWQTAQETLKLRTGDCEDGAILIYCMALYLGVPRIRMKLFAGDCAEIGGHAWLGYRSSEFPLNWCFMDWCFWYDRQTPSSRRKYYIKDTKIYDDPNNHYYSIWFAFDHVNSYKGLLNAAE